MASSDVCRCNRLKVRSSDSIISAVAATHTRLTASDTSRSSNHRLALGTTMPRKKAGGAGNGIDRSHRTQKAAVIMATSSVSPREHKKLYASFTVIDIATGMRMRAHGRVHWRVHKRVYKCTRFGPL